MKVDTLWFFFSSRRRHTRWNCDWSSDVCSSDLLGPAHVVDRDAGAVLAQPDGDRLADPGAPARDQSHLVLQCLHDVLLFGVAAWARARPSRKKAAASATVPIWRQVRAAPNGAFQNAGSPGGGPSCGPTYRYGSAM